MFISLFLNLLKERTVRETEIQTIQRKVRKFTDTWSEKCKNLKIMSLIPLVKDFNNFTYVCMLNNNCVCFPAATGEARERSRYSDDPKKGKKDV